MTSISANEIASFIFLRKIFFKRKLTISLKGNWPAFCKSHDVLQCRTVKCYDFHTIHLLAALLVTYPLFLRKEFVGRKSAGCHTELWLQSKHECLLENLLPVITIQISRRKFPLPLFLPCNDLIVGPKESMFPDTKILSNDTKFT